MKTTISFLLAVILMTAVASSPEERLESQISIGCLHTLDFRFFDLKILMKEGDGEFYTEEREIDGETYTVNFDFCEALPAERSCNNINPLAVEAVSTGDFATVCRSLTQNKGENQKIELANTDDEDSQEFLDLSYTSDNLCEGEENFGISYEIFCDKDQQGLPTFTQNNDRSTKCRPVFRTHHKAGCQVGDLNALWRFIEGNSIIFGIIAMFIGLYNLVLGRKFIKPTIGLIIMITVVAAILFVFFVLFLPRDTATWVGWLILSISVILGGIAGFFASKLVRIGVIVIGFWAGVGIGLLLNNLIFFRINHVSVLWILMAVFGLVFAILSFFWYNYIVIIATSILGSYFFVRGIALMAGGYPNEFTIFERIRTNTFNGMPGAFWAYMAGMVVACALGILVQTLIKKRENKTPTDDVYKRV